MRIKATNSSLFQHRAVKEILWGYTDPLLKDVVGLFSPVRRHLRNITQTHVMNALTSASSPQQYNGTFDGYYTVYDGKEDISKVGTIDRWRGER